MSAAVYLAGPYAARDRLRAYAAELAEIGFRISCRWIDDNQPISPETTGAAPGLDDATVRADARKDLADIAEASILVFFTAAAAGTPDAGLSGGRHVEMGYALAKGKTVFIVGEPENIFQRAGLAAQHVADWHEAVVYLAAHLAASARRHAEGGDLVTGFDVTASKHQTVIRVDHDAFRDALLDVLVNATSWQLLALQEHANEATNPDVPDNEQQEAVDRLDQTLRDIYPRECDLPRPAVYVPHEQVDAFVETVCDAADRGLLATQVPYDVPCRSCGRPVGRRCERAIGACINRWRDSKKAKRGAA